jgi:hypothetical protein
MKHTCKWILITFETSVVLAALYVVDLAATDVPTSRVFCDAFPVRVARFVQFWVQYNIL